MSQETAGTTPQNATREDFTRQIRRLQWYLGLIAARPLEFNTKSTALAQEALTENQLIEPDGSALLWLDKLDEKTRDRVLRRPSQFGANDAVLSPREGEGMHQGEKTQQEARTTQEPAKTIAPAPPVSEIEMLDVESSNLKRIGHDGTNVLRVEFHNGGIFDYRGITPGEFIDLYRSESVGKTYIALTKNRGIVGDKIIGWNANGSPRYLDRRAA